jgi:dienelactone hydrolase
MRDREIALLRTAAGWKNRQLFVRRTLDRVLGPWPDKTPLNARVIEVIRHADIKVEKLIYESQPGLHVTAVLFIPGKIASPVPGILYIPGHANEGFRATHYQNACLNLAHKGFAVLAYDPIGQGERDQEIDPVSARPIVWSRDVPFYKKHSYPGNQCFLAGVSISRHFIWDAIRGIDYLSSRPEVDPLHDRVGVAVPSCYVTSYRRMLEVGGIQDAEQNIFHGLKYGIEHADWLLARAPKPTLLLTTTHDIFSIQGAIETETEMRRIYRILGAPDNFDRVEDDHAHGYTKRNSEASYSFLMKHLGVEGDPTETSFPELSPAELKITRTGQVLTEFRGQTIFSINRKESQHLMAKLVESRSQESHLEKVLTRAPQLSGYRVPETAKEIYRGGYKFDGYRLETHALDGGPNVVIPMVLAIPEATGKHPAVIYLHPDGKAMGLNPGGPIEELVRQGFVVLAPDIINVGEAKQRIGRQNDNNAGFYQGALVGSSVVGLQAEDLARVVAWLQSREEVQAENVGLVALGSLGPTATHSAAFNPEIHWLVLASSLATYSSIVQNQFYTIPSTAMVGGALTAYDLPDLVASLAPRRVAILEPVDQAARPLTQNSAMKAYEYPMKYYASCGQEAHLRILTGDKEDIIGMVRWCSE